MPALQAPATNFHAVWDRHQQPLRDVSSLHPVFFTGRLRRSAPILNTAPHAPAVAATASLLNPVAHGYVYRDERLNRRPGGPML
ncbi:hypothetical protein ANO14919_000720 [Xylariales sp. No.14919]|nr:hypothetical protein ANO14919_000720 [Xylariales sp. No.14919]